MALGKLLYLSVPQFPDLQNGDNGGIYLIGLLAGLNTLICVERVEQCLLQGQPPRASANPNPRVMILVLAVLDNAHCQLLGFHTAPFSSLSGQHQAGHGAVITPTWEVGHLRGRWGSLSPPLAAAPGRALTAPSCLPPPLLPRSLWPWRSPLPGEG